MAQSPEQELADFLSPLPQWLRKGLWYDNPSMTPLEGEHWCDSINPFTDDQLEELRATAGWTPERYPHTVDELRPRFEQILQRCGSAVWKRYRAKANAIQKVDASRYVQMPRGTAGRRPNDDLARRIWHLDAEGKSKLEIQQLLTAEGTNLSLEGVESYFKTRRKNPSA